MAGVEDGIFGREAMGQYAALARLRWHMFKNVMRSNKGALELGARTFTFIVYCCMGLGFGAGSGGVAYLMARDSSWKGIAMLIWALFFVWQMVPIMLASLQDQFDLGILLRFPLRFGSYYLLYVVFGVADVSTILGALCCLGVWTGITIARPDLVGWVALALVIFAVFNIFLVRAIFAWIDRWLSQRKTREILGALFMIAILGLQLLNPALHQHRRTTVTEGQQRMDQARKVQAEIMPWLNTVYEVQKWFPPGLAADAIRKGAENEPLPALGSLAILGLWVLGAGAVLGARLKAEYRGESLGQAPARRKPSQTESVQGNVGVRRRNGIVGGSSPIAAVIEKEVRSLLRTLPLLYAIGSPLLLVLIFSTAFMHGNGPAMSVFPLALPVCMIYAQLGFTQVFYNNLGAEGAGIQLYFLSPTPIRTVMLAKNIFHAALFACVAFIAATLTCLRLGIPGGGVIFATIGWLLFSLPINLAIGDIFSVRMAYRLNPGRIARQRGSQSNSLLSLLVQLAAFSLGAGVFWIGYFFGRQWISALIFLPLSAIAFMVWFRVLGSIDAWANGRKDVLVAALMKTE
jgi:ABC-2 type transport system permease protein